MKKVISVSLKGNAYQLEDAAYDAVRAYLEHAERALAGNPDRAEIMADLEQAIGDKCDTFLGRHKNVISSDEIAQVLREMGPVDGADGPLPGTSQFAAGDDIPSAGFGAAMAAEGAAPRRKRLFRLPGEGMMGGVCAGLAAYFGIDVVWVRLAFVVLTLSTGIMFFVWLTLLIVMPSATSPEQIASARGETLNAREVMEMAKKKSTELGKAAASGLQDAGRNLRQTFGGGR